MRTTQQERTEQQNYRYATHAPLMIPYKVKEFMAYALFISLAMALILGTQGCASGSASGGGSPTSATQQGGRTDLGIKVQGGGSELFAEIDQAWNEVNSCWNGRCDPSGVTVLIMEPTVHDKSGTAGFKLNGSLYYGYRQGNYIYVCPDLKALRHEFSHLVGEQVAGHTVANGAGQCWL